MGRFRVLTCLFLLSRRSNRVDNATLLTRIDAIQRLISAETEYKEEIWRLLKKQSETVNKQEQAITVLDQKITATFTSVWEMLSSANQTLAIVIEMKGLATQLAQFVTSSQFLASTSTDLRLIDPTKDLPVTIEDALGRFHTIPSGWIEKLQWTVRLITVDVEASALTEMAT